MRQSYEMIVCTGGPVISANDLKHNLCSMDVQDEKRKMCLPVVCDNSTRKWRKKIE